MSAQNLLKILFCVALIIGPTTEILAQDHLPPKIDSAMFTDAGHVKLPIISPDGSKVAYQEHIGEHDYVTVLFLNGDETYRVAIPDGTDIGWHRWAGNSRLIFSATSIWDYRDVEYRQSELYVVETVKKQTRFVGIKDGGPDGNNVLFIDPEGRFIVVSIRRSVYKYPEVYRIDLATNDSELLVKDQLKVWTWVTDNQGVVRAGIAYRSGATYIYYRQRDGENFERIGKLKTEEEGKELYDGLSILSGTDEGYILSNRETGLFGLYKYNFLTQEFGELIFDHPENDITDYALNQDSHAVESVVYTDSKNRIKWFDGEFARHQAMVDKTLANKDSWISSKSRDGSKLIIYSTSTDDPGSYYLYEPAARKMERLAGLNDRLDPKQLATTQYEQYQARDGTIIPAYVTIPKGREPKNLPLIIMPHGGPFGVRDTLEYNSSVQFLANRGYVVLQPNYRGSGGYGEGFYKKGEGTVGRAMQDDLDDGMDWLAKKGVIDPARVCIVGGSYGGYAALWGVTRNPERYRCAASFAGVTDWYMQLRYDSKFFYSRYSRQLEDSIKGEDDFDLDDVSPVREIDRLTRPVLLVHGKEDSVVPFSQFTLYKGKLEGRGADAEFVTYDKEGHGFDDPKNEKDWLDKLESFLDKYNPS